MIFGNWTPLWRLWRVADLWLLPTPCRPSCKCWATQVPIPSEFLLILPYLITMIVLAGVVGKTVAPAADGKPYTKD